MNPLSRTRCSGFTNTRSKFSFENRRLTTQWCNPEFNLASPYHSTTSAKPLPRVYTKGFTFFREVLLLVTICTAFAALREFPVLENLDIFRGGHATGLTCERETIAVNLHGAL